ncbi:hypothetical protein EA187_18295 [Lujinxingia sediminis]|uniref:N-acetyltransferase domain-containing protein n=1 Tax=Lujinxingia sediminis TaxID=2480984 RepID=A0ABY0CP47_9DELT|nr:hypothetical protein [Lujinxingia sediminis]RVU41609.1 hypothetical protein EA187_18295 [Lujinxingia sediminis]
MRLSLARPDQAPRLSQFYRSIHGPEFAHQELFKAETLAQLLNDGEIAIVVATHERELLGCGLAFVRSWNQSLEISTLSVAAHPRRGEIAKALFEALRRLGIKSYGIAFFRASTESSFRRGRDMGATCWGYRPAPGSQDIDQAELLMGFINPAGQHRRAEPPHNALTSTPFAMRIIDLLEEAERNVPYPKSFPVGCPRGTGAPVISGRIWPTYHSRGNYIYIENAAGAFPVEIIKEFTEKVRKKGVRDVRLTLPVNHEQAYHELCAIGFRTVAYLPGWYLRGPNRFDCVELVFGAPPVNHAPTTFVERAVAKIHRDLRA